MNIEKLKNYNQKLLAILVTIIVLIAIVGFIFITYFAIDEISRSNKYKNQEDGILSDEKIEELQEENKRKQLISYDIPRLIDTLNLIYIIPVSHKTLKSAEFIADEEVLGLMDFSGSIKTDRRYSSQYYGDFNNLLIYDLKENNTKKLFTERVNFGNIKAEYFDDDILILLEVSNQDTYKDGVVNLMDFKSLFIYSLKEKELRKIHQKNMDVSQVQFVENSKDLLIKFGVDQNGDGKYDEYSEPSIIKKYKFKKDELTNIVDENIDKELQQKLEGTKK
jgi:hypothetical protein